MLRQSRNKQSKSRLQCDLMTLRESAEDRNRKSLIKGLTRWLRR